MEAVVYFLGAGAVVALAKAFSPSKPLLEEKKETVHPGGGDDIDTATTDIPSGRNLSQQLEDTHNHKDPRDLAHHDSLPMPSMSPMSPMSPERFDRFMVSLAYCLGGKKARRISLREKNVYI